MAPYLEVFAGVFGCLLYLDKILANYQKHTESLPEPLGTRKAGLTKIQVGLTLASRSRAVYLSDTCGPARLLTNTPLAFLFSRHLFPSLLPALLFLLLFCSPHPAFPFSPPPSSHVVPIVFFSLALPLTS